MHQILIPTENDAVLREFLVIDAHAAYAFEFDSSVKKYLWLPEKSKDNWISDYEKLVSSGRYPSLAVLALPEGKLAGRASINCCSEDQFRRELQIIIAKPFWGRGLGRIVAKLLIRRAFDEFSANVVTATVHPDHSSSIQLLQAFGFALTGTKPDGDGRQGGHLIYEKGAGEP